MKEYDYSSPGAYFVTICTKDRKNLFWKHVGAGIAPANKKPSGTILHWVDSLG